MKIVALIKSFAYKVVRRLFLYISELFAISLRGEKSFAQIVAARESSERATALASKEKFFVVRNEFWRRQWGKARPSWMPLVIFYNARRMSFISVFCVAALHPTFPKSFYHLKSIQLARCIFAQILRFCVWRKKKERNHLKAREGKGIEFAWE